MDSPLTQSLIDGRSVRTVVDGQQRLRAILEFMNGDFTVLRTHNQDHFGKRYEELPEAVKNDFWQYEVGVDVLFETELSELLDIFARLNTYSVKLNSTELLNATYLGAFKTTAHELGHRYAQFWLESKVLTGTQLARMSEVELTADLLGALLVGVSSRKQIPSFYKKFDDSETDVEVAAQSFDLVMSYIGSMYTPQELSETNFRRVHLFYSAFLSISNMLVAKPFIDTSIQKTTRVHASRARVIFDDISANFDLYTQARDEVGEPPTDFRKFIEGSRRATTDQLTRE